MNFITNHHQDIKSTIEMLMEMQDCRRMIDYGLKEDLLKGIVFKLIESEKREKREKQRQEQQNQRYEQIVDIVTKPGPLQYKQKIFKIRDICQVSELQKQQEEQQEEEQQEQQQVKKN
jgi:hypothetical protein